MKRFRIKPDHICSVSVSWQEVDEYGGIIYGTVSSIDHPSFDELRQHLGRKGLIVIQRAWWNGDRVLEDFMLNERYFKVGEDFPSGGAQSASLRFAKRPKQPKQHLSEELFNV